MLARPSAGAQIRLLRRRDAATRAAAATISTASKVAALTGLDQLFDSEGFESGDFFIHVAEGALLVGGMVMIAMMASDMGRARAEHEMMRAGPGEAVAAGEAWRELSRAHIEGFSAAIVRQQAAQ